MNLRLPALAVTALLLAACGGADADPSDAIATNDASAVEADEPATETADADEPEADEEADAESPPEDGADPELAATDEPVLDGDPGEPADGAEATRTIVVDAFDMAFAPEVIPVEANEVVTFEVVNTGEAVHEFFLGDSSMQEEHAAEMAEMGHDMDHDEPYSISLDPGETKQLTWRFPDSGEVEFACHEPGHYGAGMYGRITVG